MNLLIGSKIKVIEGVFKGMSGVVTESDDSTIKVFIKELWMPGGIWVPTNCVKEVK